MLETFIIIYSFYNYIWLQLNNGLLIRGQPNVLKVRILIVLEQLKYYLQKLFSVGTRTHNKMIFDKNVHLDDSVSNTSQREREKERE